MTRLLAFMRGAVVLTGAASLAGCMYLTPTTGVCLTQGCNDFAKARAELAAAQAAAAGQPQEQPNVYDQAADFQLITISAWSVAIRDTGKVDAQNRPIPEPRVDDSDPTGQLTFRVAFGRAIQAAEGQVVSEGISVVTFNSGFAGKPDQDQALLADAMRQSMVSLFAAEPQADERESTLGAKPGRIVTMVGPGASAPAAPPVAGQPSAAPVAMPTVRAIGRCAMHRGRGYVVIVRTLDSLYEQAKAGYDGLFEGFTFKEADPVYPPRPSTAPSGGPSALPSGAAPAVGPSASPSASPSALPAGAPSARPSAAASGSPSP